MGDSLDLPDDVRLPITDRHAVDHSNSARRRELGLLHQTATAVPSANRPYRRNRPQTPSAMLRPTPQGGEARTGIKARQAQPIDAARAIDQRRRLHVTDQGVITDRRRSHPPAARKLHPSSPPSWRCRCRRLRPGRCRHRASAQCSRPSPASTRLRATQQMRTHNPAGYTPTSYARTAMRRASVRES